MAAPSYNPDKVTDLAFTTGDVGALVVAVRKDTGASLVGTDGDYTPLQTDADGNLRTTGSLSAALPAGTNSIGGTKDNGPHWTSSFGVSSAALVSADITTATAATDAPTSGQKLVITDIVASADTAMNILFECETTGVDIFKVFVPANGTVQITPRSKIKLATADKKLTAKASVAGNVGITVCYYSEA